MHRKKFSEDSLGSAGSRKHPDDFSIDQTDPNQIMLSQLSKLFNDSIAVNWTAFKDADPETGKIIFIGNKMETALLNIMKE